MGDVDSSGSLLNPAELIANGVVSRFARLKLVSGYTVEGTAIYNVFVLPQFHLTFNGHQLGSPHYTYCGECFDFGVDEFQIQVEWVHFGKKNQWGERPTPGENVLTIQMDPYAGDPRDSWGIQVDWAAISFGAMSPLVLVHGVNTDHTSWDAGGFVDRLREKKIPFEYENIDLSTSTGGNGGIVLNAVELSPLLEMVSVTDGVKSIHLISHSMGGLDIRFYLGTKLYRPFPSGPSPKALSHFTIDTPHHGSVLADIGEIYEESINQHVGFAYGSDTNDVLLRRAFEDASLLYSIPSVLPQRPGRSDLTPQKTEQFNKKNSLPDGPVYYSIGADADLNSNGTIEHNESAIMFPFFSNFSPIPTVFYNVLGKISTVSVKRITATDPSGRIGVYNLLVPTATSTFQLNDIAVTVESSKYQPIYKPLKNFRNNHATVKSPETADLILQTIKDGFPFVED
ncbi:MAG: hypothetical protein U0V70_11075 [Terriglobia bacterium]